MNNEITTTQNTDVQETQHTQAGAVLLNTVDTTSTAGAKTVVNAINSANSLSTIEESEVLDIRDCVVTQGIRKGRGTQSDVECANIYLIDTDGQAWFSQSAGIANSVSLIASMFPDFGKGTEDGYLSMRVKTVPLNNGNTTKTLVLV